jgi:capsular exopolysaccharide synthesis family protein
MLPTDPNRLVQGSESGNGHSTSVPIPHLPGGDGTAGPPALTAPPGLTTLAHAFRRRWPAMMGLGLLGAALAAAVVWIIFPAKYTAQVLLHVSSRAARGTYEGEGDFLNFQRTQAALLKSQAVLRSALEKPEVAELAEVRAQDDPAAWLQKELVTDFLLGPEILRVTLNGDHAEDLPLLLNETAASYLRAYAAKEESRVAARVKQLQDSYRTSSETLRQKRQRLRAREAQLGLEDSQTAQVRYQTAIQQLALAQNQRLQVRLDLRKSEEELIALQARIKTPASLPISAAAVEEELRQDPVVKKQQDRLALLEENLQRMTAVSNPNARESLMRGPRTERDAAQKALADLQEKLRPGVETRLRAKALFEAKTAITKLEDHLKLLQAQEKTLDGAVHHLEIDVDNLRGGRGAPERVAPDLEALRDDVAQGEIVLKKIGDELGTLQVEQPVGSRITLLEAAEVPVTRRMDRQLKVMGAASFGTFGLILLAVALLEFRARRVYGADDLMQGLGLSLVGTLPAVSAKGKLAASTKLAAVAVDGQGALVEAVDAVRTVLLHAARTDALQVIMVTSAVGGEGKTSLASHLAASLARAWRKTLLIDCDLRHPAAHAQFDLPGEPGLSEALRCEVDFEEAIRPTALSRLWLLPAGRCDTHALQALAQDEFHEVFERLKQHYDFIVIDASPVLPVADALLVGQHADAVLLAVLRDVSRLPCVHAAHQRLTSIGIRMLGAVMLGEKQAEYGPAPPAAAVR